MSLSNLRSNKRLNTAALFLLVALLAVWLTAWLAGNGWAMAKSATYTGGNLVRNGSFEAGMAKWQDPMASISGDVGVVLTDRFHGEQSLQIVSGTAGKKGDFYVGSAFQGFSLTKGEFTSLTVTGWVKSTGGALATLSVELIDEEDLNGETYGYVGGGSVSVGGSSSEWEQVELTLSIPSEADSISLYCSGVPDKALGSRQTRSLTAFSLHFDMVQLTLAPVSVEAGSDR